MSDQLDLFAVAPDAETGFNELPWRLQVYARLTGRRPQAGTTDYGHWIGQRWVEFYVAHPHLARPRGMDERTWFPLMLDNQDVFDAWLRARIDTGEQPVSRLALPKGVTYYDHIADTVARAGP